MRGCDQARQLKGRDENLRTAANDYKQGRKSSVGLEKRISAQTNIIRHYSRLVKGDQNMCVPA